MNEWEERDLTDEFTSVCQSCRWVVEKQPKTESPDPKMTPERWQIPMERVESTCIITTAGNRKSVCDNKFEAIAE